MNPIERVWGQAKKHTRMYTNFTLPGLRKIITLALDSVTLDLIRKYFRKAREYRWRQALTRVNGGRACLVHAMYVCTKRSPCTGGGGGGGRAHTELERPVNFAMGLGHAKCKASKQKGLSSLVADH